MRPIDHVQVRATTSGLLLVFSTILASPAGAQDQEAFESLDDEPQVAIIRYKSGRILVLRDVQGQLQVYEPEGDVVEVVSRYLGPTAATTPSAGSPTATPTPAYSGSPVFFSPDWFPYYPPINTNEPGGRAEEAARQKAAERSAQVRARRAEQGTRGTVNKAGQAYPLTAAEVYQMRRLNRVQGGEYSGYNDFYSLGSGLAYFRQQELAARKELALLSYDVLLDEGLQLFAQRRYGQAARSFIAATQKDQGDPGSRLLAAQALMASGLYEQAMVHVRRAFELSPLLIQRPLNHRAAYSHPVDFDTQVAELQTYVQHHPQDIEATILLAYELFFSNEPQSARIWLERINWQGDEDSFVRRLCRAAEPMLGPRR